MTTAAKTAKSKLQSSNNNDVFIINNQIELQPTSFDIWDKKYRLRDKDGNIIDNTIQDTFKRVARALADVEKPEIRDEWYTKFLWALENGAIPAGRIIANAGARNHKPSTSTINCTVSDTINDSMDDILDKLHEAGLTLKSGAGIGYCFSTLRPKGAYVSGSGAYTSGPLSFMDIYDKMCFTVSSAGGRRGAQMATFDVGHPDVIELIKAKREDGRFRQFNISLLITDDFMEAVKVDGDWKLSFPVSASEITKNHQDLNNPELFIWRKWVTKTGYIANTKGMVACKVYQTIKARELWDLIMKSNYDYAEPGIIFIDRVNDLNNNWWCEDIQATNPCGEQGLPPYGSCLLGSINLTKFVKHPFTDKAEFDFIKFYEVAAIFTRMLDNVVEINGLPLTKQREELFNKRRHGMGILGLGSALTMLKAKYGDKDSIYFVKNLFYSLAVRGLQTGIDLAKEKGMAPILFRNFVITQEMIYRYPKLITNGYKVGDKVKGAVLYAKYSRYLNKLENTIISDLTTYGCRFTHHSSVAPTGTISLSFGNNASNGIEPSFSHYYSRNIIREGKKTKEKVDVYSYEFLLYRQLINPNATVADLPDYFVDANSISPQDHINIQAAAQSWVDSSISKTINIPTDYSFEQFKDIYLNAYQAGLKGCTTFRYNPEAFQGVLVKNEDLANTAYQFTLVDGTVVNVQGNEAIEYDGELHTAANLYDALKEGYYGKF